MKELKVMLYERVATAENVPSASNSLEGQRKALQQYCVDNGLTIVTHFSDIASGSSFHRPDFSEMLAFIGSNEQQITQILVTDWSRFSRNALESFGMQQKLKDLEIEVRAINQSALPEAFATMLLAEFKTDYTHPCFKIHKDNMPAFAAVIGGTELSYSIFSEGDDFIIVDVTYNKLNEHECDIIRQLVAIEERQGTAKEIVDGYTNEPF